MIIKIKQVENILDFDVLSLKSFLQSAELFQSKCTDYNFFKKERNGIYLKNDT